MQSGRTTNKFAKFTDVARSSNGLYYLTKYTNAFLSLRVVNSIDLGSHTLFIAELTDSEVLSNEPCCSYEYYHTSIRITIENNTTIIIPILEPNPLGTKYQIQDSTFQNNLNFAKKIINKLEEYFPN